MIKLILSIFGVILFVANYWVCEYLYPNSSKDWNEFIPMDMLCHNIWAAVIFIYALINLFETKYKITNYFLYTAFFLCFFDVSARLNGMPGFRVNWYIISLTASFILSGIVYGIFGKHNIKSSK